MRRIKFILVVVFLFVFSSIVSAQKVGLVLSGGGSKGMAHIGVIRVLEENNIPIDYITGTSIGAIVGGLYSIGYTPDEMEEIILSEKFSSWAEGKVPDKYMSLFREYDLDASNLSIALTMKDSSLKAKLPTNLIPDQPMDIGVLETYGKYAGTINDSFDNLFVPFRCIGSDVYNNKSVVFKSGDLGASIRGSMTFPFYFKPVEIDDVLIFDGGMYDNFPVEVMMNDFKPDFVIGSVVASGLKKPDRDDILAQIETMVMGAVKDNSYSVPAESGITIKTKFTDVKLMDFHKTLDISDIGYNNASKYIEQIKENVSRRVSSEELAQKREEFRNKQIDFIFESIFIEGLNDNEKKYVEKSLRNKQKYLSIEDVIDSYYELVSDNQIESAYPISVYNEETGKFDLHLDVEKSKRFDAKLGVGISSTYINQIFFGLEYKYLRKTAIRTYANVYYGKFYTSFHASNRIDLPSKIPIALELGISTNQWDYFKSSGSVFFEDYRPPYIIQKENNLRLDVTTPISNHGLIAAGIAGSLAQDDYYQVSNVLTTDTSDLTDFNHFTTYLAMINSTINYSMYPTSGKYNSFSIRYQNGEETNIPGSTSALVDTSDNYHQWFSAHFESERYMSLSKWFSVGYNMKIQLSDKSLFNNYTSSVLSAYSYSPTSHSKSIFIENFRANNYFGGGVKLICNLHKRINLRLEAYTFIPYRAINKEVVDDRIFVAKYAKPLSNFYYFGNVNLVYNSPIGPASLSVNYYHGEDNPYHFVFHFGYLIFNKKASDIVHMRQ